MTACNCSSCRWQPSCQSFDGLSSVCRAGTAMAGGAGMMGSESDRSEPVGPGTIPGHNLTQRGSHRVMEQYFMTSVTEHHENIGTQGMRTVLCSLDFNIPDSFETHVDTILGFNSFLVYIEAVIKAYCQMRLYF